MLYSDFNTPKKHSLNRKGASQYTLQGRETRVGEGGGGVPGVGGGVSCDHATNPGPMCHVG